MAIDLERIIVVDREAEHPNRRVLEAVPGESNTYDVTREEGLIIEAGTPLNADLFNSMQDNFEKALKQVDASIPTIPSALPPTAHASTHRTGGSDALSAADIGAVPTTRTVNGRALSANISLTANDVSALPITGGALTGQLAAQDSAAISKRVRNIQLATTDLTAGSSSLTNGVVYMVYET